MKGNSGITMIELVVVLVIIVIVATIAVTSGRKTLDKTDVTEVYTEMDSMKKAISALKLRMEMNDDILIEQGKYYDADFVPVSGVHYGDNVLGNQEDWYIILGIDEKEEYLNSEVKENLGMDAINHTYIVNYDTSEIELYRPVEIAGIKVRTYEEIRGMTE